MSKLIRKFGVEKLSEADALQESRCLEIERLCGAALAALQLFEAQSIAYSDAGRALFEAVGGLYRIAADAEGVTVASAIDALATSGSSPFTAAKTASRVEQLRMFVATPIQGVGNMAHNLATDLHARARLFSELEHYNQKVGKLRQDVNMAKSSSERNKLKTKLAENEGKLKAVFDQHAKLMHDLDRSLASLSCTQLEVLNPTCLHLLKSLTGHSSDVVAFINAQLEAVAATSGSVTSPVAPVPVSTQPSTSGKPTLPSAYGGSAATTATLPFSSASTAASATGSPAATSGSILPQAGIARPATYSTESTDSDVSFGVPEPVMAPASAIEGTPVGLPRAPAASVSAPISEGVPEPAASACNDAGAPSFPLAYAEATYEGDRDAGDLSFRQGDLLLVTSQDPSGWWTARCADASGSIPGNYCRIIQPGETTPAGLRLAPVRMVAGHAYAAAEGDATELTVDAGEELDVIAGAGSGPKQAEEKVAESGWTLVQQPRSGRLGFVPLAYLQQPLPVAEPLAGRYKSAAIGTTAAAGPSVGASSSSADSGVLVGKQAAVAVAVPPSLPAAAPVPLAASATGSSGSGSLGAPPPPYGSTTAASTTSIGNVGSAFAATGSASVPNAATATPQALSGSIKPAATTTTSAAVSPLASGPAATGNGIGHAHATSTPVLGVKARWPPAAAEAAQAPAASTTITGGTSTSPYTPPWIAKVGASAASASGSAASTKPPSITTTFASAAPAPPLATAASARPQIAAFNSGSVPTSASSASASGHAPSRSTPVIPQAAAPALAAVPPRAVPAQPTMPAAVAPPTRAPAQAQAPPRPPPAPVIAPTRTPPSLSAALSGPPQAVSAGGPHPPHPLAAVGEGGGAGDRSALLKGIQSGVKLKATTTLEKGGLAMSSTGAGGGSGIPATRPPAINPRGAATSTSSDTGASVAAAGAASGGGPGRHPPGRPLSMMEEMRMRQASRGSGSGLQ